ncbi:MAG: sel1 repeat family protein, partial [Myxococcales bacterium]|nr:sel1 repeat family protein [Myxococcales bacterium]
MRNRLALSLFLALLLGAPAWADFEAGKQAALQGDYATAYQEWLPLAEGDDAEAQFLLGLMHREGRGVAQDLAQSVSWLRRAADLGHREAQFYLARAYRERLGVAEDDAEAARLFRAAAEQDHAEAAFTLGLLHRRGQGVAKDDLAAARWYLAAAGLGHGEARFTLGAVSEEGKGIARDLAWAYAWYTLAAESGVELAAVLNKRLSRRMTPAQLTRGRDLAQEWRTAPPEFAEVERMARLASAVIAPKPAIRAEVASPKGEPAQPMSAVAAE